MYNFFPDGHPNAFNRGLVEEVRVTSPFFRTRKGFGIGTNWYRLHRNFPHATQIIYFISSSNKRVDLYDDKKSGIAFEVQNDACVGIVIHPKGRSVRDEYLSFYPSENGQPLIAFGNQHMTHHSVP